MIIPHCSKHWNSSSKDSLVWKKYHKNYHIHLLAGLKEKGGGRRLPLSREMLPNDCWRKWLYWFRTMVYITLANTVWGQLPEMLGFHWVHKLPGIYKTERMCAVQLVTMIIQWATLSKYVSIWFQETSKDITASGLQIVPLY